jgi:hypothetical protein
MKHAERQGEAIDCFSCEGGEPELNPEDAGIIDLYQTVERWGLNDSILRCFGFPANKATINKLIIVDAEVKAYQKEEQERRDGRGST